MYSVYLCARLQTQSKEYLKAKKRIFKYFSRTIELGLFYPISRSFDLIKYSDADYNDFA